MSITEALVDCRSVSNVEVRRLSAGDANEVERFAPAFDQPVDPVVCRRFLEDDRHHLLVAYVEGRPAGFVSATEILHPDKPLELFLNELSVIEGSRRRGAASALLEELKRLARDVDAASIWVLTDEENVAATATYRKAGGAWDGARSIMFEIDTSSDRATDGGQ